MWAAQSSEGAVMANPERGEVDLEIDGKTYTLRWGLNQMAVLQDRLGLDDFQAVVKIVDDVVQGRIGRLSVARTVFWSAFQEHHPEITENHALDLLERFGMANASGVFAGLAAVTVPEAESRRESPARNPRKAQVGRGANSTSRLARSA